MKKIITIVSVITFVLAIDITYPNKSDAQTVCKKDYFGNVNCTSSGGGSWTGKKDYFGNDNWTNNRTGKTTRCKKDYFGNYVCN